MRERDRERLGAEHDEINYQSDNQDWPEWEAEPESHDQNCEDGEHGYTLTSTTPIASTAGRAALVSHSTAIAMTTA